MPAWDLSQYGKSLQYSKVCDTLCQLWFLTWTKLSKTFSVNSLETKLSYCVFLKLCKGAVLYTRSQGQLQVMDRNCVGLQIFVGCRWEGYGAQWIICQTKNWNIHQGGVCHCRFFYLPKYSKVGVAPCGWYVDKLYKNVHHDLLASKVCHRQQVNLLAGSSFVSGYMEHLLLRKQLHAERIIIRYIGWSEKNGTTFNKL